MQEATGDRLEPKAIVAHRYRIVGYRGDRGFGQVYEAEDSAMDRRVALMRLRREFSQPEARERFYDTRGTVAVEDPRIVDLCDYGDDVDGRLFLVMPWIEDAEALDERLLRDWLPTWAQQRALLEQIAEALAAAHAKGVLHGGLEPSRVLVGADERIHIVDFGLAPALTQPHQGALEVSVTTALPGRVEYLSPEQIRGEAVDARSDIYALGVLAWELATGAPPFTGDVVQIADAHVHAPLPKLPRNAAHGQGPGGSDRWLPPQLEPLLRRALAKDPRARLASATEFLRLLTAMPTSAPAPAITRVPTERLASPADKGAKGPHAGATGQKSPSKPPPRREAAGASKIPPPPSKSTPPPLAELGGPRDDSSARPSDSPAAALSSATGSVTGSAAGAPARAPGTAPPSPTSSTPGVRSAAPASQPPASPTAAPSTTPSTPAVPAAPAPSPEPSSAQPSSGPAAGESAGEPAAEPQRTPAATPPASPQVTAGVQALGVGAEESGRSRRRLGKLELAVLGFLAFDLLLFGAWKLFGGRAEPDSAAVAQLEAEAEPEPAPEPAEPEPEPQPAEPQPDADPDPTASVHEAIAAELPPEPDTPGPVRPTAKSLSDKAFRQAMVEARDAMLRKCLDTRMRRTLKVALKVAPSGKVEYARVVGSLNDTTLGQCVVKQVYKIDFPPTSEGGSHTYTLRLR